MNLRNIGKSRRAAFFCPNGVSIDPIIESKKNCRPSKIPTVPFNMEDCIKSGVVCLYLLRVTRIKPERNMPDAPRPSMNTIMFWFECPTWLQMKLQGVPLVSRYHVLGIAYGASSDASLGSSFAEDIFWLVNEIIRSSGRVWQRVPSSSDVCDCDTKNTWYL